MQLVETTTATTYTFRGELSTWARCTINNSTGELSIQSDWGNWGHSWHIPHTGHASLSAFFGERASADYIAGKLLGRAGCTVFDIDATIAHLRGVVIEKRREGRLDAETARDLWNELGDMDADGAESSVDLFIERWMTGGSDHLRIISEEPWEDVQHRPSREYRALVDIILPALIAECAKAVRNA